MWEAEGLSSDELFIVLDLYLRFLDMAVRDNNYQVWVIPLKKVEPILKGLRPGQSKVRGLKMKFWSVDRAVTALILSPYAYYGLKNEHRLNEAKLISGPPKKVRVPPKRYLGVGYRDKGNLRDKCYDGQQNWSEVVTDESMRKNIRWNDRDWSDPAEVPEGIPYGADSKPGTKREVKSNVRVSGKSEIFII